MWHISNQRNTYGLGDTLLLGFTHELFVVNCLIAIELEAVQLMVGGLWRRLTAVTDCVLIISVFVIEADTFINKHFNYSLFIQSSPANKALAGKLSFKGDRKSQLTRGTTEYEKWPLLH